MNQHRRPAPVTLHCHDQVTRIGSLCKLEADVAIRAIPNLSHVWFPTQILLWRDSGSSCKGKIYHGERLLSPGGNLNFKSPEGKCRREVQGEVQGESPRGNSDGKCRVSAQRSTWPSEDNPAHSDWSTWSLGREPAHWLTQFGEARQATLPTGPPCFEEAMLPTGWPETRAVIFVAHWWSWASEGDPAHQSTWNLVSNPAHWLTPSSSSKNLLLFNAIATE